MPNIKLNLENRVFGNLVGISATERKINKSIVWKLKCGCGKVVERSAGNLIKSEKLRAFQSCGCSNIRNVELNVNKTYGYLTPIKKLHLVEGIGYYWEFKCICGKKIEKVGSHVSRGQGALHCGCIVRKGNLNDISGKVFGNLRVIGYSHLSDTQHAVWDCQCICGSKVKIKGFYLQRGKTDCGCIKKYGNRSKSFAGVGELYGSHWGNILNGAKMRKLPVTIDIYYAWNLFLIQNKTCALTGMNITLGRGGVRDASLDRIDSTKGYEPDNVQWVHKDINTAKWDKTNEQFIELCKRVTDYNRVKTFN